jgi:putative transposase
MAHQKINFVRLQQQIDRHEFRALEKVHFPANSGRKLTHWGHFTFWLFALAKQATSLRDAVAGVAAAPEKFYHAGLKPVPLSTVSEANSKRSPEMYRELFFRMLEKCRHQMPRKVRGALRILDSTTITFSDARYGWAKYQSQSHGVKIHLMFTHESSLPQDVHLTHARDADVKIAHRFAFDAGNTYVMDRGYTDSKLWRKIAENKAFFVIRLKKDLLHHTLSEEKITGVPGVLSRKTIVLTGNDSQKFGDALYVFRLHDQDTGKEIEVATNNAALSAAEVSDIYRKRWAIELFFKWLKQNLKLRRMLGFSENAVRLQIWISLIFYLLLWRMYRMAKEKASGFLEFVRYFRSRLLLAERPNRQPSAPKPTPDDWLPGFPVIPTEQ